jgi:Fe-S-cluster containining protein
MKFPCSGCGSCCKRIKSVVEFLNLKDISSPLFFPFQWNSDGICENLSKDNKCKVYENRPLICNVEKLTEFLGYDKRKFYSQNVAACNKMMDEDNVPLHFRIN